jgi:hypothetical protein
VSFLLFLLVAFPASAQVPAVAAGSLAAASFDPAKTFDGSAKKSKNDDRPGLRFMGIELGGGPPEAKPTSDDAFTRKGIAPYLDWDIRLRIPINGFGLRAAYRHPKQVRAFSFGGLVYYDWPGAIAGDFRDSWYDVFGSTPDKHLSGYRVDASAALDPSWGVNASYDDKSGLAAGRWRRGRTGTVGAGWSPLGGNPGKPWDYTVIANINFERLLRDYPGLLADDRQGFGWLAGLVFQYALDGVPTPWLRPVPVFGPVTRLDRVKTTTTASASELYTLALKQAVELSFYLGRHLELTPGLWAQFRPEPTPDPDEARFAMGATIGLDLNNLRF